MRSLSVGFRDSLESVSADDVLVIFATITHPDLLLPIRVNSDVVDYVYGGETFVGCGFHISFLSDDDQPPQAQVVVPNVDRRIGEAVLALDDSPRIQIELLSSTSFDTQNPRTEIGTVSPEYIAPDLFLRNVNCDASQFTADIFSFDVTTEPWPKDRTTPENTPALFR